MSAKYPTQAPEHVSSPQPEQNRIPCLAGPDAYWAEDALSTSHHLSDLENHYAPCPSRRAVFNSQMVPLGCVYSRRLMVLSSHYWAIMMGSMFFAFEKL